MARSSTGRRSTVLGSGSGHSGDRLQPALDLAASGRVEYLVFDRLGETSMANFQRQWLEDPAAGADPQMGEIATRFAPYLASGGHLVGNFGGANLDAAVEVARAALAKEGASGVRIGVVRGDDVMAQLVAADAYLPELDCRCSDVADQLISANAYIGAGPIVDVLDQGAQVVIGGRICDASMGVGVVCHALGWDADDWDGVALGTLVGHLLTGGAGLTGGGFADPPYRTVRGLENLGFAMAEVSAGEFTLSKLDHAGGEVTTNIIKSRIAYEVHDPAAYLTPDVAADFSQAEVEQLGPDRVRVTGITGRPRPPTYRVLVGLDRGWKAIGETSFGGPGCLDRARLGEEMVRKRLAPLMDDIEDLRYDLYGYDALFGDRYRTGEPAEVRVRVAARCATLDVAREVAQAGGVGLYWGPAGGGGSTSRIERAVGITEAFLAREAVTLESELVVA